MKTKLNKISLFLLLFTICSSVFSQTILVVSKVTETGSVHPQDSALIAYLEDLADWTFDVIDVTAFGGLDPDYSLESSYLEYDAIYISEVISSSAAAPFATAGYPIPCVTNEGYAVLDGKWSWIPSDMSDEYFIQLSGEARTTETYKLIIHDEDNFICEQYDADYELLWTSYPDSMADGVGVTGFQLEDVVFGALNLGHFGSDSIAEFPSFWAIPEGSIVVQGNVTINSNIVIIGTVDKAVGIWATEEYNKLIWWSLKWAMGDETVPEVSVKSITQNNDLNIWPNPTNGIVYVSLTTPVAGNAKINIYNIAGNIVQTIESEYLNVGKNNISINLSDMVSALYYYEIITEKDFFSGKIIKR